MKGGRELCNGCGFMLRFDDQGELVEYATTSKSHPAGVWDSRRAAGTWCIGAVLALGVFGCTARASSPAQSHPTRPQAVMFDDLVPGELRLCVMARPIARADHPYVCITLGDLRAQLRGRRLIHTEQSS